jgi:hypothetical protein
MSFYEDLKDTLNKAVAWLKGVFHSWTIWFNGFILSATAMLPMLQDQFPTLQEYLPDNVYKAIMGSIAAVNILLRMKTTKPLSERAEK